MFLLLYYLISPTPARLMPGFLLCSASHKKSFGRRAANLISQYSKINWMGYIEVSLNRINFMGNGFEEQAYDAACVAMGAAVW